MPSVLGATVTNSNRPKRILVITSDEPIGEIVTSMLQSQGYHCEGVWEREAISGALKASEEYDLLFCQVSALEDGEQLLKWVLGPARHIPLIACAVRPPEQVPKSIYDRCTLLHLPFEKQQLVAVVQEALRGVREIGG